MLSLICALFLMPATADTAGPPQAAEGSTEASAQILISHPALRIVGGEGELLMLVENAGPAPDRVVSVATRAGTVGKIAIAVQTGNRSRALAPDDRTIAGRAADAPGPALSVVAVLLTDLVDGPPAAPVEVTVTFEHAGAVTVNAEPTGPGAPAPPA
jgi:hypothetical protein